MTENKFWVNIWSIFGVVAIVIILCIASYNFHQLSCITKMVESGANPVEAKYSIMARTPSEDILAWQVMMERVKKANESYKIEKKGE